MKIFFLLFLIVTSTAWSRDRSTHQSLAGLLEEVRDPVFSSAQRKFYLSHSRALMARKLAQEFGVPEGELNLAFVKNPTKVSHLMRDPWYDVQTQFYTTLHQENFQKRWIDLQRLVKFSDYGKSLQSTMMAQLGHYSTAREGRYYVRWNKVGINSGGRNRSFTIPYFLMSSKIDDLINMEAHVPYEELLPSRDLSPSRPGLQTFINNTQKLSRIQRQELAEKMELNQRIYIRAVANAAKTIASIHYLTGSQNRHMTERKVGNFIEAFCDGCSASEKKEYQTAAMTYVDQIRPAMSATSISSITQNFCTSLKANHYYWNIDRLKPTPVELLADQTKLLNYYTIHKLKGKNREALAKTILAQDMGILFLTGAINILDKSQEPVGTKLLCSGQSLTRDANLVRAAITEAESNIQSYVTRINRQLMSGRFNLNSSNITLEYFVQTNQAATAEAMAHYPQGIGWVLKTITTLDKNVSRRKKTDKIVTWGGSILGVGLIITGIGAPEGVAVLISSIGLVKGVSSGTYFLLRSQQEKQFGKEMRLAKRGSSGLSEENLKQHYRSYKSLKVQYIKEFGSAGLNFINLHRLAMSKSGGDVVKAHNVLRRAAEAAKETGKEQAFEQLQDLILNFAVGS